MLWDTIRIATIASRDDDEPSIYFGRWAASDEKGREENAGESSVRTGATPCMYAGIYML